LSEYKKGNDLHTTCLLEEDRDRENNMEYGMKKVQQIYIQHSNSSTDLITWDDKS